MVPLYILVLSSTPDGATVRTFVHKLWVTTYRILSFVLFSNALLNHFTVLRYLYPTCVVYIDILNCLFICAVNKQNNNEFEKETKTLVTECGKMDVNIDCQ